MPVTRILGRHQLVIESGEGDVSVGAGTWDGTPSLAVFNAGPGGVVGEPHPNHAPGDSPVLVVTMPSVTVVDTWITVLTHLRQLIESSDRHDS